MPLTSPRGVTGIRGSRADRWPALRQLRAISRAAAGAADEIVPAVTASAIATVADVDLLNDLVREAQASLAADGLAAARTVRTGVTAAIPSVVFMTRDMAPRVDFFTIATDELTAHLLFEDSSDAASGPAAGDPLHPAVVRAIRMVAGVAAAAQRPVSASGSLSADPIGALVLVGLGVDELSADAASLEPLRRALAAVSYEDLQRLAARALDCGDAATVRAFATRLASGDAPAR